MNVLAELKSRFRPVLAQLVDDPSALLDMIRPAQDSRFGDYQANCAMPLGKQLGQAPRAIAAQLVESLDLADLCEPLEIAGPGFINLRLKDQWLVQQLEQTRHDDRLGVPRARHPRTYVIDFSSPNVAKPLHVGHIRSSVIGDALCHMLRFAGHRVISDNHLGDWGTQFGMIIYGYRHFADQQVYRERPVDELARVYRLVRRLMDIQQGQQSLPRLEEKLAEQRQATKTLEAKPPADVPAAGKKREQKALRRAQDQLREVTRQLAQTREQIEAAQADAEFAAWLRQHPNVSAAVLEETARLHAGDPENRRLWHEFLPECQTEIRRVYDRLNISFDFQLGESFYHDRLSNVVESLHEAGLATESEGAICVFLDGFEAPMIVRKKDGAYLYATTDLATIQYRMETWQPDTILYVVDFRQGEHFDKLFAAAQRWGYEDVQLRHIRFGTVLGDDGRPFQTRSGDTIGLEGLLDEAERKAYDVVCAGDDAKPSGSELPDAQRRQVAKAVGIAALKYADLSQNRTSDYVFSYDKMLALNGNTATYMQYSYARVHGIFQRGGIDIDAMGQSSESITVEFPAERALGLQLLRFSEAIDDAIADYRPNLLTNYLYDLAKCFSIFFELCPVLKAGSDQLRDSRLLLCDRTARTLKQGLELLGIEVVEKM